jgi:hypothetical protein
MYINPNEYEIIGETIKLTMVYKNSFIETIFDKKYYNLVKQYHWRTSKKKNKIYVCSGNNKYENKLIYLQNLIYGFSPDKINEVDHIDGNSLNNKKENLRLIPRINNIQNVVVRIDNKTTGIRGVSWDKRDLNYNVDFYINKKRMYFRPLKNLEEAVYLRMLCEKYFLKEFRNTSDDISKNSIIDKLSSLQKQNIESYLNLKLNEFLTSVSP